MPGLNFDVTPDEIPDEHDHNTERPVPTRKLLVIAETDVEELENEWWHGDPEMAPEMRAFKADKIIGYIEEPTVFCPGLHCREGDTKDPLRYYRKEGTNLWVHSGCGLPTKSWWTSTFKDLVIVPGQEEN